MPALHPFFSQPRIRNYVESREAVPDQDAACALHLHQGNRPTYWPVGPLQAFTLKMASHGLCVSSAMMLGDPQYATAQLAHAHELNDDALRELSGVLFSELGERH